MRRLLRPCASLALTLAVIVGAPLTATAGTIVVDTFDHFDSTLFPVSVSAFGPGTASLTQSGLLGVLGGERTIDLFHQGGLGGEEVWLFSESGNPSNGQFVYNSGALDADGRVVLTYGDAANPLNLNGLPSFVFDVRQVDLGAFPIEVVLTDEDGNSGSSFSLADAIGGPKILTMSLGGIAGLDYGRIVRIQVNIDPGPEYDLILDSLTIEVGNPGGVVEIVPEPSVPIMLLVGGLLLASWRLRGWRKGDRRPAR